MASRTVYARPVVVSEERLTEVMITKAKQRAQKEALDRQVREARGLGQDLSRRSRSPGHSTSHLSKYSALGDNPSSPFLSPQGSPTLRPVGASGGVSRAAATRYTLHYGNDGQCLFTSDNEKPVESRPSGVRRLEEPTSSTLMRSHSHEEFHGAPPSAYNTNSLPVELIRRMERGDFSGAPRSSASPVRDHEGGAPSGGLRHHGMEDRRWADAAEPTRSPTARFPSRGAARDTTPRKNVGGRLPPLELPTDTSPSTMVEVNLDRSVDSGVSKVERLQRELEARQDAMRKMRQKEKGWERQVEQLKVELRHARQTERSTAAQARSPARGPPRRAETAPDPPPKALDGGGPMHPTGVRRPDPRRPQRPKESKPDFTKAQRFNAGNFRPITAPDPPESSTLDSFQQWHAGYPEEEPLPKPKGPSPMEGNLQLASKSAQKTALGLSEEAADLPVLIEYEHIFQFAEAQIITAQQAEGLWKFLMGRRTVSSAPAPNTLDDMPAQAKSQRVEASPRRDGTPERRPQRQDYDQGASPRPVFAAGLRKKIERIHGKSRPKVERQDDLTSEDADCSITSSSSRGLGSFSSEVMDALEEEEHRLVEAEPVRRHLS